MGDLMKRQPQPELLGRKGELLLDSQHVRTHVVHDVLIERILFLHDEKVVLTEHPARHPAQDHAEFRPRDLGHHRCCQTRTGPRVEFLDQWIKQATKRGNVGVDPTRPIRDPGAGGAGE
ncbi:unannotated protein [freshwater metagenome]|uniref:Unannotated protein n=1 Tax=freshwater metagenome TaxID=449393 RepID=A0A6J7JAY6_9ZZZZ